MAIFFGWIIFLIIGHIVVSALRKPKNRKST